MCFPSDLFLVTCVNIADFHNLEPNNKGGYSPLIWTIWVGVAQQGKFLYFSDYTPYLGEFKTVLDCGFRIPGTWSQSLSVELGFWIQIVSRIPDSLSCTSESKAQDYGFHRQYFPQFPCLGETRLAGDIKLLILTKNNSDSALGNHKSVSFLNGSKL